LTWNLQQEELIHISSLQDLVTAFVNPGPLVTIATPIFLLNGHNHQPRELCLSVLLQCVK